MTRDSENPGSASKLPLRVLFCEDHSADVELCLWTLNSAGFEVTPDVVVSVNAALQVVSATE